MGDIRMAYTLTEGEFLESRRHVKLPSDPAAAWALLGSGLVLLALLYGTPSVLGAIWQTPAVREPEVKWVIGAVMPWVYVVVWWKFVAWALTRSANRMLWRESPALRNGQEVTLTEEELRFQTRYDRSVVGWASVLQLSESPNLFLLRMSGGSYHIFPKRALPEGVGVESFRKWLGSKVNSMKLTPEAYAAQSKVNEEELLLPEIRFTCTIVEASKAFRVARQEWVKNLPRNAVHFLVWVSVTMILLWLSPSIWLMVIVFVVLVAAQIVENHWRWRRAMHLHGSQVVAVTESGMRFTTKAGSEVIGWGGVKRYMRKEAVFVLVGRDERVRIVPESALLTAEGVKKFEELLRERVVGRAGFAVLPG